MTQPLEEMTNLSNFAQFLHEVASTFCKQSLSRKAASCIGVLLTPPKKLFDAPDQLFPTAQLCTVLDFSICRLS